MIVYSIEVRETDLLHMEPGSAIWDTIAKVTGSHVNREWCKRYVRARGACTMTRTQLMDRRAYRFDFEKAP